MEIMIYIGKRLLEERKRLNLSQEDLARVAATAGVKGATRQSLSNYEKGGQEPSASFFSAISAIGVDINYIITGVRALEMKYPAGGLNGDFKASEANQPLVITQSEQQLLENFRAAPESIKMATRTILETVSPEKPKKGPKL